MKVVIEQKKNGYVVTMNGFIKVSGEYVFKATEIITMLEFVGSAVEGAKVEVVRK